MVLKVGISQPQGILFITTGCWCVVINLGGIHKLCRRTMGVYQIPMFVRMGREGVIGFPSYKYLFRGIIGGVYEPLHYK